MFKKLLIYVVLYLIIINFANANTDIDIKVRTAILQDYHSGEVLYEKDITSMEIVDRLSEFHVWSDTYIQERRNWKPDKPFKAIFLKTFKIPEIKLPLNSNFQGCKSWVEINSNFDPSELVLNESKIQTRLEKFRSIVNEI